MLLIHNPKSSSDIYISIVLCSITLLVAFILTSCTTSADVVDDVAITVPVACSLTSVVDTAHTATIQNNHLESDIGTTTFTTHCNDNAGFSIYAIGYSGDTYGNTNMLPSNSDIPSIATGLATSGSTSAWAMKLIPVAGTYTPTILNGFNNYREVPTTYTKVATFNTVNDATIGSTMQSAYRVFASATQPADTYTGKVRYTLVHPASETAPQPQTATSGCINYFANASTAVGTMGCQSISSTATSATLLASNFSRTGYGFAGWSDAFDYATNPNAHFYGPNEDITFTAGQYTGNNDGLALYAVWIESVGSLQDTNKVAELCGTGENALTAAPTDGTANLSSVSALTDLRDNDTYAIAKLADGKCWMIENLRLEAENTRSAEKQALAQSYGGQFAGLADAEPAWAENITITNSLYSIDGADNTINIGTSNAAFRFPRYNHDNTISRASNPNSNNAAMYSYGNYYTWAAAIADTTAYNTNNQSVTSASLCPAGWHLPTAGLAYSSDSTGTVNSTGRPETFRDFYNLGYKIMDEVKTAYEDTPNSGFSIYSGNTTNNTGKTASQAFRGYPNNFIYSGHVKTETSSVSGRGANSSWWSSTPSSYSRTYYMRIYSYNVSPGTGNDSTKTCGRPIRCVADI